MATPTRVYIVTIGDCDRLVRATHPSAALMHVARDIAAVGVASQDELIDCLERVNKHDSRIYACKQHIRMALAKLAEGEAKTRRVRGKRRRAKLEFPGSSWNQSILKEAWNSYPSLRDQALRIGTVDVRAREFAKIRNESGPADFEQFKGMILSAEKPSTAPPTVTIEE